MEKVYTIAEVAEYLKISEGTVYKLMRTGKLPTIKILGNTRIKESDLVKLVHKDAERGV